VADESPPDRLRASDVRLEELLRSYGALIRRVVARVAGGGAPGGLEDVEQQVVINLWRALEREQTIDHPTSYVYRAAVRETVRAVRRAREREQAAGGAADLAPRLVTEETPERQLEAKRRGEAIQEALTQLQPDRRKAVQAHLSGFEVAEIMRLFGWPYQKTRNLISRGMADLRELLMAKGIRG
jgi:RNA polymerase sigma-70 factor (ECF subfamily)